MNVHEHDFSAIRAALAAFEPSPRVEPNETILVERAFLPGGHRGVLDLRRQLVVGNRGMGKSFWTHALLSPDLRNRLAEVYGHRLLTSADVVVGFNGSDKVSPTAPTIDEITSLLARNVDPGLIWRAVLTRIASKSLPDCADESLADVIASLEHDPNRYSLVLSAADDALARERRTLLIVFDALERLGRDWDSIRRLTRSLLSLTVGLQSFKSIRAKIFMRVDQFSDQDLFQFPDSSKIKNDHVDLIWQPTELYELLLFELWRNDASREPLETLAARERASDTLRRAGVDSWANVDAQARLISGIAGEFMGSNKKRGQVYTWVPLHLSDAAHTCSPRSFLIAWKKAAEHLPAPEGRAVDHLGLLDGVRSASTSRLRELYEDYPWIKPALEALRRQFVPMEQEQLFDIWERQKVIEAIRGDASAEPRSTPVKFLAGDDPSALLSSMRDVGVMEERANGKINVPDIFRVEAEILRKGGVAVPKRAV
ncbi:MAG: ATP-binding protein [Alphaproteobacteria bacterium]|nr:ATP-binding protein [Alphaproteobacteria bacterium]